MKYLIDTHTFLWILLTPEKLSKKSYGIIEDSQNEILFSIITLWEISLKYNLGKLELNNVYPEDLPDIAKMTGLEMLNLNKYDVSSFHKLPKFSHKDPFDRLLIWQAIQNNLIMISKDENFSEYIDHGLRVFW